MAEDYVVPRTTKHSFDIEATEGTTPTDAAGDSILVNLPVTLRGLGRNWVDRDEQNGGLGRFRPLDGGPADDLGWDAQIKARGSGTHGSAPESGAYFQCTFGEESLGVAGTVAAAPSPTTTGFTVEGGGTTPVGNLCDIEIGADNYETRRILTNSTEAVTFWPPTSAAAAAAANTYPGVSYQLTSTPANMNSGTGFFYFENGEKAWISGARGNAVFTLAIREPLMVDFAMNGIRALDTTQAAIGYTWAPPDLLIIPPMCLGIELRVYIPALVKTGSTATDVLLKNVDGTTSLFEATDAVDKLIVDVGSSVYETKTIATWTYATQNANVTALSGAPTADDNAYIERTICVNDTITFDPGRTVTKLDCISNADGWVGSRETLRESTVEWSKYFKSFIDYRLMRQAAWVEMWAVVGSTRGNKIAICAPNVFRQDYTLDLGGDFGTVQIASGAYTETVGGNDQMFLTFL